jgi:hypothetical protein
MGVMSSIPGQNLNNLFQNKSPPPTGFEPGTFNIGSKKNMPLLGIEPAPFFWQTARRKDSTFPGRWVLKSKIGRRRVHSFDDAHHMQKTARPAEQFKSSTFRCTPFGTTHLVLVLRGFRDPPRNPNAENAVAGTSN